MDTRDWFVKPPTNQSSNIVTVCCRIELKVDIRVVQYLAGIIFFATIWIRNLAMMHVSVEGRGTNKAWLSREPPTRTLRDFSCIICWVTKKILLSCEVESILLYFTHMLRLSSWLSSWVFSNHIFNFFIF